MTFLFIESQLYITIFFLQNIGWDDLVLQLSLSKALDKTQYCASVLLPVKLIFWQYTIISILYSTSIEKDSTYKSQTLLFAYCNCCCFFFVQL